MPIPRTPEALEAIEQQVILSSGDLIAACRSLQISPVDLNQWMQSSPEVSATIENARRLGWMALESEAIRRAMGYDEEVWFQGEMVGTKKAYSDGLMQTLLKARVPGHKEDSSATRPMVQVNILPRASTYEEWQAQRQIQLNPQVQDAEWTDASQASSSSSSVEAEGRHAEYTEIGNGLPDWL